MDLLVVGGTRFVGRFTVEAARALGLNITLFHRGRHPDVFPDLPSILGDRDVPADLEQLAGRAWDAVIDTCAYRPEQVRAVLDVLQGDPHYTLISSVSVYDMERSGPPDEDAPRVEPLDGEELSGATYAGLKVGCEEVAESSDRAVLIIRPGLVAGPHDPTDRFTYWCLRVAAGGQVLAPESPDVPAQWIDARDLGEFIAASSAARRTGRFNVVNPAGRDTFGGLLGAIQGVASAASEFVWVDAGFLSDQDVSPWSDLPLYLSDEQRDLMRTSSQRALAAGLECRPTVATVRDTLAWAQTERGDEPLKAGLDREREAEVLAAWRAAN